MRLYELRREEKMREARTWVIRSFHPQSVEDFLATMKTDEYTYIRMVTSYWDMAASFVVHGAIDPEMFRAVSGEMLAVYCKVEHMIDELREVQKPFPYRHIEQVVADWPGAEQVMGRFREYFKSLAEQGT
ncbi:MAG: hypothetical protein MK243_04660 [Gemmatimonadetes bacterium]|jgi:mannose-6-phosphate isomerase-like protein (cupin superfamily)|nr:hypothetical protein [Gemmatimonadota bacterium]|tara:strand:+ start:88 stop:477 length:390 start_codon:yes stop_codon:yes gene_type:complete